MPKIADGADKYELYMESVQSPEHDVRFYRDIYRDNLGVSPVTLREDFCGTASVCCAWVKRWSRGKAIGVDLDREPLKWGVRNNASELTSGQKGRTRFIRGNVLNVDAKADIILAINFSYFVFKEREKLARYFSETLKRLNGTGLFVLDIMGGPECHLMKNSEKRKVSDFVYVWEHDSFDPITNHCFCRIHFSFKDGSKLKNAFVYDWRIWSLPEVKDILKDVGFKDVMVYWEDDEGVFERRDNIGENLLAWTAVIVATP